MTYTFGRLSTVVDQLEEISLRIDSIMFSPDREKLHEFTQLRREIAVLFYELSRSAESLVDRLSEPDKSRIAVSWRQNTGQFKTALAMLQSEWPLPDILKDVAGYRAAKKQLDGVQQKFLVYLRSNLLPALKNFSKNARGSSGL